MLRTAEHVGQEAAIEAPVVVPQLANPTAQPSGRIEIALADGTVVRMDPQVDELALRRVLILDHQERWLVSRRRRSARPDNGPMRRLSLRRNGLCAVYARILAAANTAWSMSW